MRRHVQSWCAAVLAAALLLVVPPGPVGAQERSVTGQVVDARTGVPIQAVTVSAGDLRTLTDREGRFVLAPAPAQGRILFQRVGYRDAELPVTAMTGIVRLEPAPVLLETLTVEARRGELLAAGTALTVAEVGRQEIAASGGTSLAEALDDAEGVSVSWVGAWGSRAALRGLSGERVAVLIDGNRVSRACTFGMDQGLATVDPATVERVEILSGPGSALYGSGNIGGVINVVTRRPRIDQGTEGEVRLGGSSGVPGGSVGASLATRLGGVLLAGAVDGASYADYRTPAGTVDGSSYRQLTADLGVEWAPAPAHLLSAKGQYYAGRDIGWPMQGGAEIPEETRTALSADWGWQRGGSVVDGANARAFFQKLDHHMVMSMIMSGMNGMAMTSLTDAVSYSETAGARAQLRLLPREGLRVELGSEATHLLAEGTRWTEQRMGMNQPMELSFRTWPGVRILDLGAFAQGEMELGSRVSVSAGVRLDRVDWKADQGDTRDEWITSGNAGMEVALTPALSLRGSVGAGYRTPDPLELYGLALRPDGFVYRGSSGLETERSLNTEVSLAFVQGGLSASVTAFRNRVDEMVVPALAGDSVAGRPVREYRNLGEARLQGVTSRLGVPLGHGLRLSGNLSYTDGEDPGSGAALPLIPPLEGGVAVRRDFGSALRWLEVEWSGASEQDRVSTSAGEGTTPAWAVANLRAGLEVAGASLTMGVENLLDERYRAHLDPTTITRPGRNFFVRVTRSF